MTAGIAVFAAAGRGHGRLRGRERPRGAGAPRGRSRPRRRPRPAEGVAGRGRAAAKAGSRPGQGARRPASPPAGRRSPRRDLARRRLPRVRAAAPVGGARARSRSPTTTPRWSPTTSSCRTPRRRSLAESEDIAGRRGRDLGRAASGRVLLLLRHPRPPRGRHGGDPHRPIRPARTATRLRLLSAALDDRVLLGLARRRGVGRAGCWRTWRRWDSISVGSGCMSFLRSSC